MFKFVFIMFMRVSLTQGFTNGKNGAHSADGDAPLILCKTSSPALLRKLSDLIVCEIAPSVSVFGEVRQILFFQFVSILEFLGD